MSNPLHWRREVNSHDFPKDMVINAIIVVSKNIADAGDRLPRDTWVPRSEMVGYVPRCCRTDFDAALGGAVM